MQAAMLANLVLALAAWVIAIVLWPLLPYQIPVHFDVSGRPDAFMPVHPVPWFGLVAVGSCIGLLTGVVVPRWIANMARTNSQWINMPHRARFRALPTEDRVRAVRPMQVWLAVLAMVIQTLFVFLLCGSYLVGVGTWQRLSPVAFWIALLGILASVLMLIVDSFRAVRRAVDAADRVSSA